MDGIISAGLKPIPLPLQEMKLNCSSNLNTYANLKIDIEEEPTNISDCKGIKRTVEKTVLRPESLSFARHLKQQRKFIVKKNDDKMVDISTIIKVERDSQKKSPLFVPYEQPVSQKKSKFFF